jgi:4a-hydroxytetrahydrobiopterin dehydratase
MDKPKALSQLEISNALTALPGWQYLEGKLTKEFKFADFHDSLNFIDGLVDYFDSMDHHPDVHIFYSKVKFELLRYDIGEKVSDRDVEVAHKIEDEYAARKGN